MRMFFVKIFYFAFFTISGVAVFSQELPMINELYLKPVITDDENEEYLEILLPSTASSPSSLLEYGLIIIDNVFILEYYDFSRMKIKKGSDDINNEETLVVISNNETTPNLHFYYQEMSLRGMSSQALLLVRRPTSIIDINKLELKQIVKSSGTVIELTRSAPLTNGNEAVLRRLTVDAVVYRKNHHDDANDWLQRIEPRWRGTSHHLPTGNDDSLDKMSLARCDQAVLSGFSYKIDYPTPGMTNLCANNGESIPEVRQPAGLLGLQENRLTSHVPSQETTPDVSRMEALPENQISNYLGQLKENRMLVPKFENFIKCGPNRKYYSFHPNLENFQKSAVRCDLCYRTHHDPLSSIAFEGTSSTTPHIMKEGGLQFRSTVRDTWRVIKNHDEEFHFHKRALEEIKRKGTKDYTDVYEEIASNEELVVTANKIALIYLETKVGLSIRSHEVLSQGLLHLGFPIGHTLNGRNAAQEILKFLGEKIHCNLIQRLIKSDVEFSLMLDASTDVGLVHTLLVYIRYTEDGMPVLKVLALTEAHDSTANGMWTVIEKLISDEGEQFVSYFKRRCVAMSTDGASSMLGNYNSLKTKISAYVLTGERAGRHFQTYHCANHKLALAYNDVMYSTNDALSYCKRMTDNCNKLARFYSSKSYKRRDEMVSESEETQESIRSFKRIQKVRWVPATQTSYENIIHNYKTFMSHLRKICDRSSSLQYPHEARDMAQLLKETYTDKNFIAQLHLHLDIIQEFSKWAKTLEKREATVIDLELWYTQIVQAIENMKVTPGPNLDQFLQMCQCGNVACQTLDLYEQTRVVVWKDNVLTEWDIESSGIPKLSQSRDLLQSTLVDSLRVRFPPDAISAFSVLLPSFIHLRTDDQWHNLGIYLNQYYGFPTSISSQLIVLKNHIITTEFHNEFSEDPPEVYWPNAFRNKDFPWSDDLKRVIRIALVQPSSTAQVESGFSLVTAIKTKHRSRLATPIVQDTLRVKFNGPSVEYLPKFRLARDWINDHHLRADTVKHHKSHKVLKRSEFVQTMRF